MALLEFIFRDGWHFVGFVFLTIIFAISIEGWVKAARK